MKKLIFLSFFSLLVSSQTQAQPTVGLFLNDSLSVNGYVLFGSGKTAYLIDNCGNVVHTWESNFTSNTAMYLLENGDLLRTSRIPGSFNGGGTAGRIERFNWDGDLLWAYNYSSPEYHLHHDIEPLPNGNFLLIAWEARTMEEAIEAGRNPSNINSSGIWPEQIVEIEMVGDNDINLVWGWYLWDHLVQDFDSTKANYGVVADHPELVNVNFGGNGSGFPGGGVDWIHLNAVDYHPELDQIALSSRHFSEVWIIDHSTTTAEAAGHTGGNSGMGGDLLYRWGNPRAYDRGGDDEQTLYRQHDFRWILEENHPHYGKVMVFNNGSGRPGGNYSSIDIWTPPTDQEGNYQIADDAPFGPTDIDWTFEELGFYSATISGVHPLPNDNLFICEGNDGRFFEVTLDGEIVWEYINPVNAIFGPVSQGDPPNSTVFRATRYPTDFPAFEGKDLTPGGPLELDPWPSDCVIYDGTPVSSSEALALQGAWLRNNPVGETLMVVNETGGRVNIEIWDMTGRLVESAMSADYQIALDASNWMPGFYLLRISDEKRTQYISQKFVRAGRH